MSDFVSGFWNWYVVIIVLVSVVGCGVFLWVQSTHKVSSKKAATTTGHVWDETLAEYNNPLPFWWMWLFYITIVFSLVYLILYPGLGNYPGLLDWTSAKQLANEKQVVAERTAPLFDGYLKMDLKALAANTTAMETGKRLFQTYCIQCHGATGQGTKNFPDLTQKNKRWGNAPEDIKASITDGRAGVMLPYGGQEDVIGGPAGAKEVAQYVRSLAGFTGGDPAQISKGKEKFQAVCVACHGEDGKGMAPLGAPNLTDRATWIYGTSEEAVVDSIMHGRNNGTPGRDNSMPKWAGLLREGEIQVLTAYVMHLSQ